MNHLVTLGWLPLAAFGVALDGSLALRAIDRLAQSESYTDIQNVMTVTNAPIRSEVERGGVR
jgi:CRISPR/Cas system-associated protein Cas5 (RAMP superfamily)